MTEWPRPGWFLFVSSILIIGVCLLMVSTAIAGCFTAWGNPEMLGVIVLGPISAIVGFQQYWGVFRSSPRASNVAAFVLMLFGALLVFGCVAGLIQTAWEHGLSIGLSLLLLVLGALGTFCLLVAAGNHRWAYVLTYARKTVAIEKQPRWGQFSLREMLLWTTILAVMAGLTTGLIRNHRPRYGVDVDRQHAPAGVPEGATNIHYCYHQRPYCIAYEFTISEEEFRRWVEGGIGSLESNAANVPLEPIVGSEEIARYCAFGPRPINGTDQATVTNGLRYFWSEEYRMVHAVFDRDTGRAYFYSEPY